MNRPDPITGITFPKGKSLLHNPILNKGTAFTKSEREYLQLDGLLPPYILTLEEQKMKVLSAVRLKETDMEKYMYLTALQDRNETLFYKLIMDEIEEFMPIIYTPTVGQACQEFGHIFRRPRGIYISAKDKGSIEKILCNWPQRDVDVIVVTDGERILGLGDLGADGMGIPIGKLSLYTACAGVHPGKTLPITIDIGTNNDELLADPLYIGTRQKRMVGTDYDSFMDEFMDAAIRVFPDVLIQFEDFANHNAQRLLDRYRNDYCTFNDDIQGTASVVLAGLFSAMKLLGTDLSEHRFLFYGAGSAATGIGDLIIHVLKDLGYSDEDARQGIYLFDSKGLVTTNRDDLSEIKIPFARDCTFESDFDAAIETIKPTAIIGVSGMGGAFDQRVIQTMAELNDRPIIFALSNPTSKSECSAQQAYEWTNGKAIFASGSPFDPVSIDGKQFIPGQGNNAYIFPGLGFGAVISKPKQIQDDLFISAAETLASMVSNEDLKNGLLYPPLNQIREISIQIATNVAQKVFGMNGNESQPIDSIENTIREQAFVPEYKSYI
jgi:malate dehydrogenase (oxaloacetate-decarboxylating)(NADP+)